MHSFLTNTIPDIKPSPDVLEIHPDKSIGIEEIRQITAFLSKKPIQSEKNTVIIHEAHLLTLPAQHAFLKTLEEPPAHSQIYLVTEFPSQLLPTILSRVQDLSISNSSPASQYSQHSLELFKKFLSSGVGERLKLLDEAKFARDTALEFFSDLEKIIHSQLSAFPASPQNFQLILDSKRYLKSNANLKLVLDNFAIQLRA